jgi:hypothetical protein
VPGPSLGLLFIGSPFMLLVRGVLFFSLKGIYDYLRPLMFVIGLFCVYQGVIVFWVGLQGIEAEEEDPATSTLVIWGKRVLGARPGRYCLPRHPSHSAPSCPDLNGIL